MDNSATLLQALGTFVEESKELILQMEELLLRAESGGGSTEDLHALFRCAHTIKGSGGLFGLDEVVRFTHVVENVLDLLRQEKIQFSSALISLLLECQDQIATLVSASLGEGVPAETISRSDALMARLKDWSQVTPVASTCPPTQSPTQVLPHGASSALSSSGGGEISSDCWHISVRLQPNVFAEGLDPMGFIQYLTHLGELKHVETVTDYLPQLEVADPEVCYLGFEVALKSEASKKEIEDVFEFLADYAQIRIFPPHGRIEEFLRYIESVDEGENRIGEMLVACGTLTQNELDAALREQSSTSEKRLLGQILVENNAVSAAVVEAAVAKQSRNEDRRTGETKSIKVPSDRLDALINRVGELVIAGAGTFGYAHQINHPELKESASLLLSLVEDVRDMTLRLRMVPIGEVFARFPRVVRDVSKELGKNIELTINGAESELDKSMVEMLGDPLMHLIRNAMDHGIETAEARLQSGKPATATVGLNAFHESGTIVVEVSDDGKGLDAARILAKAIEKGLVAADVNLSEQEIFRLIMAPGFSTAETITNLSGRGVGMDVVRSNVEAMRGTLDILSKAGQGTTMRICLPLTLAIIDGFHVGVGNSHFIVPLDLVVECVELPVGCEHVDYIEQRNEALPIVRLRQLFGDSGGTTLRSRVVIVRYFGRRVGLVVDRIFGKCQTVIKPLGPLFDNVPSTSGATILGSGEVALIIDVPQLMQSIVAHA